MTILYYILAAVIGAAIALTAYIVVRRIMLKGQKDEIIEKARLEAENIRQEKIFQAAAEKRTRAVHQREKRPDPRDREQAETEGKQPEPAERRTRTQAEGSGCNTGQSQKSGGTRH